MSDTSAIISGWTGDLACTQRIFSTSGGMRCWWQNQIHLASAKLLGRMHIVVQQEQVNHYGRRNRAE
jgi:hypothetical protein